MKQLARLVALSVTLLLPLVATANYDEARLAYRRGAPRRFMSRAFCRTRHPDAQLRGC